MRRGKKNGMLKNFEPVRVARGGGGGRCQVDDRGSGPGQEGLRCAGGRAGYTPGPYLTHSTGRNAEGLAYWIISRLMRAVSSVSVCLCACALGGLGLLTVPAQSSSSSLACRNAYTPSHNISMGR